MGRGALANKALMALQNENPHPGEIGDDAMVRRQGEAGEHNAARRRARGHIYVGRPFPVNLGPRLKWSASARPYHDDV